MSESFSCTEAKAVFATMWHLLEKNGQVKKHNFPFLSSEHVLPIKECSHFTPERKAMEAIQSCVRKHPQQLEHCKDLLYDFKAIYCSSPEVEKISKMVRSHLEKQ